MCVTCLDTSHASLNHSYLICMEYPDNNKHHMHYKRQETQHFPQVENNSTFFNLKQWKMLKKVHGNGSAKASAIVVCTSNSSGFSFAMLDYAEQTRNSIKQIQETQNKFAWVIHFAVCIFKI